MIDPGDLPPGEDPPPLPVGIAGVGQVITGTLDTPSPGDPDGFLSDYYSFFGEAGQVWTFEVMSYLLPADGPDKFRYADNADVAIVLLGPDMMPVVGGVNDDDDDTPPFGDPDFLGGATPSVMGVACYGPSRSSRRAAMISGARM